MCFAFTCLSCQGQLQTTAFLQDTFPLCQFLMSLLTVLHCARGVHVWVSSHMFAQSSQIWPESAGDYFQLQELKSHVFNKPLNIILSWSWFVLLGMSSTLSENQHDFLSCAQPFFFILTCMLKSHDLLTFFCMISFNSIITNLLQPHTLLVIVV